jgi:hypothetical protein
MTTVMDAWDGKGTELVADIEQVTRFAATILQIKTKAYGVDFVFDKSFGIDNLRTRYSRSIVFWGGPMDGYTNMEDEVQDDEQDALRKEYMMENFYDTMTEFTDPEKYKSHNSYYFMIALFFDVFIAILLNDCTLAIISIMTVFGYMAFTLDSLFLATIGISEIILSLPTAWWIGRNIFQVKYFAGMNGLIIFIVAAIGADDIFVFMDAYHQSAFMGDEVNKDFKTRMSWVYRRAGLAMFITSSTTCSAFLCTLATPIAGPQCFGIFAALVILMDYVLVMSLFCTAVVLYHERAEKKKEYPGCFCCCCQCAGVSCFCSPAGAISKLLRKWKRGEIHDQGAKGKVHDQGAGEPDAITAFFQHDFTNFILNPRNKMIITAALVAWIIPAAIFMAKLEPTKTVEQGLASDHPLQISINIIRNEFGESANDEMLYVYYTWGVGEVDRTRTNGEPVNLLFDPSDIGTTTWDTGFSLTPACQLSLVEACDDLRVNEQHDKYIKRSETGFGEVHCLMDDFVTWANSSSFGFPVALESVNDAFAEFIETTDENGDPMLQVYENMIGWDGNALKFLSVAVESRSMTPWSRPPEEFTRDQYDGYLKLGKSVDALTKGACGGTGVLMTDLEEKFVFMNNQMIYRTSAVQGALVGVAIAFVVLLLATGLPLVAFMATCSILCTLVSVVGATTMMGWSLGTTEAILISILAGFSVDYVVHLAHAFVQAPTDVPLEDRVRQAFSEMGVSVLSGMLTSVLASLPLFACQVVFFVKFGTFLCFTIAFSWLFANFGFMSALSTFGDGKYSPPSWKALKVGPGGSSDNDVKVDVPPVS